MFSFLTAEFWTFKKGIQAVILAIILGTAGYFVYDHFHSYHEALNAATTLKGQVSDMQQKLATEKEAVDGFKRQLKDTDDALARLGQTLSDLQHAQERETARLTAQIADLHSKQRRDAEFAARSTPDNAEALLNTYNQQILCYTAHLGQLNSPCALGVVHVTP